MSDRSSPRQTGLGAAFAPPLCTLCERRPASPGDDRCERCRLFVLTAIRSGSIPWRRVPRWVDVVLVMTHLGVDQDVAERLLKDRPVRRAKEG